MFDVHFFSVNLPHTGATFLPGHTSVSSSFPIQHSMLDVGCSMFIFFSTLGARCNVPLLCV